MKVAYVILHYNTYDTTCECIEKIISIKGESSEIVVIDNCSPNLSGQRLLDKYACSKGIHVILSESNLGYARGNNIGFEYAKKKLKANAIVVLNNDVLINQHDFEIQLKKYYDREDVAVIAPMITTRDGCQQNPYAMKRISSLSFLVSIAVHSAYYFSLKIKFISKFLYNMKLFHDGKKRQTTIIKQCDYNEEIYSIVPCGACVIFMRQFIEKFDFAFLPLTFLYGEEDLLYDLLYINKLNTMYTRKLHVLHYEGMSTKEISDDSIKRELFKRKCVINSTWKRLQFRKQNHILF